MKKSFNNAGVALLQAELMTAPLTDRQTQCALMRINFKQFMLDNFDLSSKQIAEIGAMSAQTEMEFGEAIANTWESGQQVNFQKDTAETTEDPKDVILSDPNSNYASSDPDNWLPISIHIRYSPL
jgi:hypothetical protein